MESTIKDLTQAVMVGELSKDIFSSDEQRALYFSNLGEILQNDIVKIVMGNI